MGSVAALRDSTTATLGSGDKDMFLPTDFMRRIPGLLDERPCFRARCNMSRLMQDARERGFLPDQDAEQDCSWHQAIVARLLLSRAIRGRRLRAILWYSKRFVLRCRYKNGGEMVEGPFAPDNIARIAARGPSGSEPENFAQGGPVRGGIGSLSDMARGMFRA
jgi:hypothetical protein